MQNAKKQKFAVKLNKPVKIKKRFVKKRIPEKNNVRFKKNSGK